MLGDRVKQRREELGLTQTELADRLGYKHKSSICSIERGREKNPTIAKLKELANALCTSEAWLMGLEDEEYSDEELLSAIRGERDAEILIIISKLNDANFEIVKNLAISLLDNQGGE